MVRLIKSIYKNRICYLFLLPSVTFLVLFLLLPMAKGISVSLYSDAFDGTQFVGLQNYINLFGDPAFLKSLANTCEIAVIMVPCITAVCLVIAYILNPMKNKVKALYRSAFYLPTVCSGVALTLVWKFILNPFDGVITKLYEMAGAPAKSLLESNPSALYTVIFVIITINLGQPLIIFMAAMGAIPTTYYEAADIDGASGIHKFFKITIPLIKPTILYVVLTTTVGSFQVFVVINMLTRGGPVYGTSTVLYLIYNYAFLFNRFSSAAAMGVVLFIIILALSVIQYKLMAEDIEY